MPICLLARTHFRPYPWIKIISVGLKLQGSKTITLYLAARAYHYDCEKQEPHFERAWSALPSSEREILQEPQKYFPYFVEIPKD
jgi:hypothetical protein